MKIKLIKNSILLSLAFFLLACNSNVETPSYVYIESVDFAAGDEQGTSSSKIPDVWVTANGTSLGTYQLPALVPVLASGKTELIFEAGIKLNGLSVQRPKYPLYTLYKETVTLVKGRVDTISPSFSYQTSVKFSFIEDFESAGLKFYSIPGSAELKKTQDSSLIFHYRNEPNNFSGIIELPDADTIHYFDIRTTSPIYLNSNSVSECFVEINYCFTQNVEIGLYCYSSSSSVTTKQVPIANIVGTQDNLTWNKVYINLTDEMADATINMGMTHFNIYMKSGISRGNTARFLFDNIKVVYR